MANSWIEHVKKVAKQRGIKYNEALKVAGASYKKKGTVHKGKKGKKGKKGEDMEGGFLWALPAMMAASQLL